MFTNANTLVLEWGFVDRNGGRAQMTMHLPFSTTLATLNTFVSTMAPLLTTLSNATIERLTYRYRYADNAPGAPAIGSNSNLLLSLYYRNESRYEQINLPAPDTSYLETEGAYQGIRLDTSLVSVQSALSELTTALEAVVTPEAEAFPTEFLAGGVFK